jgi:hypothetical protein
MMILALTAGYVLIYLLKGPGLTQSIDFHPDSGWRYLSGNVWCEAKLCFPLFVTYWMVIVRFSKPGRLPRSVVILSDSVDRTEFRLLRVRLLQLAHAKRATTTFEQLKIDSHVLK